MHQMAACHRRLLLRLREDRRAVAWSDIGVLPIHLRGIVRNREKDAQQRAVAHDARIEGDAYRLRMARPLGAYRLIIGGLGIAPGVAGRDTPDAFHLFEHRLRSPEAAASEDGMLQAGGLRNVLCRTRHRNRALRLRRTAAGKDDSRDERQMPDHPAYMGRRVAGARAARLPSLTAHELRWPSDADQGDSRPVGRST